MQLHRNAKLWLEGIYSDLQLIFVTMWLTLQFIVRCYIKWRMHIVFASVLKIFYVSIVTF